MTSDWKTPSGRRYVIRLLGFMAAYIIVLMAVVTWFKQASPPTGALRYIAAAAPALPVLGVIWAMAAYMIELPDEYQRMKLARSMLWGTGVTLAVCTVWGFLQNFADVATPPLYMVFGLFMAAFGVVQGVTSFVERGR